MHLLWSQSRLTMKTLKKRLRICGVFIKIELIKDLAGPIILLDTMKVRNKATISKSQMWMFMQEVFLTAPQFQPNLIAHLSDGINHLSNTTLIYLTLMITVWLTLMNLRGLKNINHLRRMLWVTLVSSLDKIMMKHLNFTIFKVNLSTPILLIKIFLLSIPVWMKRKYGHLARLYTIKIKSKILTQINLEERLSLVMLLSGERNYLNPTIIKNQSLLPSIDNGIIEKVLKLSKWNMLCSLDRTLLNNKSLRWALKFKSILMLVTKMRLMQKWLISMLLIMLQNNQRDLQTLKKKIKILNSMKNL